MALDTDSTETRVRLTDPDDQTLVAQLRAAPGASQRRAIAKLITLLESTLPGHRQRAAEVMQELMATDRGRAQALRLGVSGVPGVGKSTFIEALGLFLIGRGHRVAVLAVDPSSQVSGGSILGDKTRMERLSTHEQAFIRPSPSSGTLGGVTQSTREAMRVFEAAGYDIIIVETVGVGQSETAVAGMTDLFLLMQLPNAGDDLQAIKRGVMERCDVVVINKADLDADAATRAQAHITSALRLMGLHGRHLGTEQGASATWQPAVLSISALHGSGLEALWQTVAQFCQVQRQSGRWQDRRHQQDLAWMWERVDAGLRQRFDQHPAVRAALAELSQAVREGRLMASLAAQQLLDLMDGHPAAHPARTDSD